MAAPDGYDARATVYDRSARRLAEEQVFERGFMDLAYGTAPGRWVATALIRRAWFSTLYGLLQGREGSRRKIGAFIERYGIDVAELDRPLDAYRSFREFFERRLKPDARRVDRDPRALIAPADARLLEYPIERGTLMPVKARRFTLAALTGGVADEARYGGGRCLVYRLAPADYHRFCYVDDGAHAEVRRIPGFLQSVSPLALRTGLTVFHENRRDLTVLETEHAGRVVELDVGALVVGRIVQHHREPHRFVRGEEKGYFGLGGSTIVLLYEPGRTRLAAEIAQYSAQGIETLVRYGERIGDLTGA